MLVLLVLAGCGEKETPEPGTAPTTPPAATPLPAAEGEALGTAKPSADGEGPPEGPPMGEGPWKVLLNDAGTWKEVGKVFGHDDDGDPDNAAWTQYIERRGIGGPPFQWAAHNRDWKVELVLPKDTPITCDAPGTPPYLKCQKLHIKRETGGGPVLQDALSAAPAPGKVESVNEYHQNGRYDVTATLYSGDGTSPTSAYATMYVAPGSDSTKRVEILCISEPFRWAQRDDDAGGNADYRVDLLFHRVADEGTLPTKKEECPDGHRYEFYKYTVNLIP